ncbi:hypothetical protein GUITHDRAFT_151490 [Guillardia theta CCMP2712]|uniref:Uncharacterized protein n=2 Tax=Guillardia theta TaxID=55529 RepID=L1JLA6_GUITC|nr:hypothetical protein GUITHDRAFT_151490 [Guillardia theta CCMP2712]EKX49268.1 hypothetical protein GUITHDRAFT_151490 [Guillardia theta CCMP2712]|eukprot:XP_005836248.1 hypothetical protein GUITHDRAFT_151490 [Guillardia theta CCMP2712]
MISPVVGVVSALLLVVSAVLLSSSHRGQSQLLQRGGYARSGLNFALAHGTRQPRTYDSAFRVARPRQVLEQTGDAGNSQEFVQYLSDQSDDILDEDEDSDLGRARQAVKDAKERVIEDAKRLHDIGVAIEEEEAKQNPSAAKSHKVQALKKSSRKVKRSGKDKADEIDMKIKVEVDPQARRSRKSRAGADQRRGQQAEDAKKQKEDVMVARFPLPPFTR